MTLHEFLERHGFTEWAETFEREDIDLVTLAELSDGDLKELGLPMGARKRLQRAIRGGSSGSSGLEYGGARLGGSSSIDLSGASLLDDPTMHSPASMSPQGVPESIDGYRVESVLGQGGMGSVFRVVDKFTDRPLALKTVKVDMLGAEQIRQRFQREYGLLQGLHHPGIVRVFAMGEDPHWGLYYTMELLTGGTLADWAAKRKRSPDMCLKAWNYIAQSLKSAHSAGIIHRDLKPENIMLRDGKTPVIVDWGLGYDGAARSHTGARGTAAWAPPEQATGRTGPFTDVYGMSALLLWLLTEERPTNDPAAIERFLRDCNGPLGLAEPLARGLSGQRRRWEGIAELQSAIGARESSSLSLTAKSKQSEIMTMPNQQRSTPRGQDVQQPLSLPEQTHVAQKSSVTWPSWAHSQGEDEWGPWAEIVIDGAVKHGLVASLFGSQGKQITQRLRYVAPGTFLMGSQEGEKGRYEDEDQYRVTLSQGYWLADSPCTQALWQGVMGNNPSHFTGNFLRPVEQVNWNDTQEFLTRLNRQVPGLQARLPNEADWEYAARAGSTGARYGDLDAIAWHSSTSNGTTHSVKHKQPNAWGLYDMIGNVWERCNDWYGDYPRGAVTNPIGPASGSRRVCRGGSWNYDAACCRAAYRYGVVPGNRSRILGFRFLAQSTGPEGGGR